MKLCVNTECRYCENGECQADYTCSKRINTTHTPTYAEEQLEHAKEKQDRCYREKCSDNKENKCIATNKACFSRIAEPINYEEEYHKLKKENEGLKGKINTLNSVVDRKDKELEQLRNNHNKVSLSQEERLNSAYDERVQLIEENKELKEAIKEGIESVKESGEVLQSKNKRIKLLESQLENELNRNRVLIEKLQEKPININNYESEINKLRCQHEEAKYYIEAKEAEIKNIKKKLEESEMINKMIKILVEGIRWN